MFISALFDKVIGMMQLHLLFLYIMLLGMTVPAWYVLFLFIYVIFFIRTCKLLLILMYLPFFRKKMRLLRSCVLSRLGEKNNNTLFQRMMLQCSSIYQAYADGLYDYEDTCWNHASIEQSSEMLLKVAFGLILGFIKKKEAFRHLFGSICVQKPSFSM